MSAQAEAVQAEMAAPVDAAALLRGQKGGFVFDNCLRNSMLTASAGLKLPMAMKTGTTICGLVFNGGVVLGADTRATEGNIVADKNCQKIHFISKKIFCAGAGTAADTEMVTGLIASQLELHRLNTGREPRVVTALTRLKQRLFQYQGHIGAYLVLAGVDATGAHLYTCYAHGSSDRLPFATLGSGSLAAMAVFESGYQDDMDEKQAVALVTRAIEAGVYNDEGSGSNVDVCVVTNAGDVKYMRNHKKLGKPPLRKEYPFKRGTTAVIAETREVLKTKVDVESDSQPVESGGAGVAAMEQDD